MPWTERLLGLGAGLAFGWVLNKAWEFWRLPGYDIHVFKISSGTGTPNPPCEVYMGADDLAQLGISGTIGAAGLIARSSAVSWVGGGMAVGTLLTKVQEVYFQIPCPPHG
jgi:hypothetical protein